MLCCRGGRGKGTVGAVESTQVGGCVVVRLCGCVVGWRGVVDEDRREELRLVVRCACDELSLVH